MIKRLVSHLVESYVLAWRVVVARRMEVEVEPGEAAAAAELLQSLCDGSQWQHVKLCIVGCLSLTATTG